GDTPNNIITNCPTRWPRLNDKLRALKKAIPRSWLDCAAVGTAAECARKVRGQFDLGVDGVIMHGATPLELTPIVHSYREQFSSPTPAIESV
ncbi:luciferase, partial [Rhodococcus opacus RKJ300 = JCM 13270]